MKRPLVLALMLGLACTRAGSSIAPAGTGAQAPTSEAAGSSDATPATTMDHDVHELAPWIRGMFDPKPRRTYSWSFIVDTHDPEAPFATDERKVHCRSDGPTRYELEDGRLVLVACQICEFEGKGGDEVSTPDDLDLDECYIATTQGLWVVETPPSDAEAAAQLVDTPPYLPARPEPRSESWTRVDERWSEEEAKQAIEEGWAYQAGLTIAELVVDVGGAPVTAWCRTDWDSQAYGESTARCLAPGFGLVSADLDGRNGPSTEDVRLLEISPLPAQ
jgi:hypothetical protein